MSLDNFERSMIRVGLQELIDEHNDAIEASKAGK